MVKAAVLVLVLVFCIGLRGGSGEKSGEIAGCRTEEAVPATPLSLSLPSDTGAVVPVG